jgi:hypothetical protein
MSDDVGIVFLIAAIIATIPAYIAWRKGHSFLGFYVFGFVLWIVALLVAVFIKADESELERRRLKRGEHRCPHCREFVRIDASVCPHCRRDIAEADLAARAVPRLPVSFRELSSFPKETEFYRTPAGKQLAILPDGSLIFDDGKSGLAYQSAADYRTRTNDRSDWTPTART